MLQCYLHSSFSPICSTKSINFTLSKIMNTVSSTIIIIVKATISKPLLPLICCNYYNSFILITLIMTVPIYNQCIKQVVDVHK